MIKAMFTIYHLFFKVHYLVDIDYDIYVFNAHKYVVFALYQIIIIANKKFTYFCLSAAIRIISEVFV